MVQEPRPRGIKDVSKATRPIRPTDRGNSGSHCIARVYASDPLAACYLSRAKRLCNRYGAFLPADKPSAAPAAYDVAAATARHGSAVIRLEQTRTVHTAIAATASRNRIASPRYRACGRTETNGCHPTHDRRRLLSPSPGRATGTRCTRLTRLWNSTCARHTDDRPKGTGHRRGDA